MIEKTKKLNVPGQKQTKQVKIALVGDSLTGKSSFMKQYISNQFVQNYVPTLGVETGDKYIDNKAGFVHVTIWDFNGKLDFADLRNQFYRQADLVLVFCDLSNKNTIESIDFWVREAKDNSANTIVVVGNKSDSKKGFDAQKVAKQKGCQYFQASSKTGQGIQQIIQRAIAEVK